LETSDVQLAVCVLTAVRDTVGVEEAVTVGVKALDSVEARDELVEPVGVSEAAELRVTCAVPDSLGEAVEDAELDTEEVAEALMLSKADEESVRAGCELTEGRAVAVMLLESSTLPETKGDGVVVAELVKVAIEVAESVGYAVEEDEGLLVDEEEEVMVIMLLFVKGDVRLGVQVSDADGVTEAEPVIETMGVLVTKAVPVNVG
jgi:hypothetical protein